MGLQIVGDKLQFCRGPEKIIQVSPGVKRIAGEAFAGNTYIREVYVPEGVSVMGPRAFYKCKNLRKLVLPNSMRRLNLYSVAFCDNLEEITLGNQVEEIDYGAFFGCHRLKAIQLPHTLRHLGSYAFACCSGLEEVVIPNGVLSIGEHCFDLCLDLRHVFVPASVRKIGTSAFRWCSMLFDLQVDPANPRFSAEKGNLLSKDGHKLLCSPESFGYVSIPDSITALGKRALYNIPLSQVDLPPGLQRIEKEALACRRDLKAITLPEGLRYIGEQAFACTGITELVVPESVNFVGPGILSGCWIQHITILGNKTKVADVCEEKNLFHDAMLTADAMEIEDYPKPFTAVHGFRSVAARWAAGERVPDAALKRFRKFLKTHYMEYWDDPKTLALIATLNVLPLEAMNTALQKAEALKDPSITAALLQYQHEAFSQEQIQEQWKKQMREEVP